MIHYALSKRQLKELANGKRIRIAIPYPAGGVTGDLLTFARRSLTEVSPDSIRAARRQSIEVWGQGIGDGSEVEQEIGAIVRHGAATPGDLIWLVEVVLVELCNRPTPRGEYPPQWPRAWEVS